MLKEITLFFEFTRYYYWQVKEWIERCYFLGSMMRLYCLTSLCRILWALICLYFWSYFPRRLLLMKCHLKATLYFWIRKNDCIEIEICPKWVESKNPTDWSTSFGVSHCKIHNHLEWCCFRNNDRIAKYRKRHCLQFQWRHFPSCHISPWPNPFNSCVYRKHIDWYMIIFLSQSLISRRL